MPDENILPTEQPTAETPTPATETLAETPPAVLETPTIETPIEPPTALPIIPTEPTPAIILETPTKVEETPAPSIPEVSSITPTVSAEPATPPPINSADRLAGEERPTPINNLKTFLSKALEKIRFRKNAKLEKIIKFTLEKGQITNDQTQKILRVSDATASRYLSELVKQGRLKRVGQTSASRYEPNIGSNGGN
jgi:hypothetical protein